MTWIKQNYDRFLLAVFALVLLVSAGLLIVNARGYSEVYTPLEKRVVPNSDSKVKVDQDKIDQGLKDLGDPHTWQPRPMGRYQLPLFVSVPYVSKDENGTKIKVGILENDSVPLHPPIDNEWFLVNHLDLLAPNALEQDPDNDGFSNLDEYLGKTDPNNKDSHPPYYSKLFFKRLHRVPFHLRFEAKNNDTFFINNTDNDEIPTQRAKLGESVVLGKFKFKLTKFEPKFDTAQGFKKDISELTLVNTETNQQVVLPKGEDVDSPTTYVVLDYIWNGPGAVPEFAVQRDGEFTLAPESSVKYKVVDFTETEAKVVTSDGKKELHIRAQPPK